MDQYRTSGILNEAALHEIEKCLVPPHSKWLAGTFAVLYLLVAVLAVIMNNLAIIIFSPIFMFVFLAQPVFMKKRFSKVIRDRMKEVNPSGSYQYGSFFTADGVVLHNETMHGEVLLRYESLSSAASTPNFFFVMSKSQQFFLVFKNCLTPEQQESFLPFLKEKCPKLKIMR